VNPIRIVIADDHALLRAGLRGLLAALEGVEVVGEAPMDSKLWSWSARCGPTS